MGLDELLDDLSRSPEFAANVSVWRRVRAQPGRWAPLPSAISPELVAALQREGVEQLYTHQAQAWEAAANGVHFIVVTPTASGKTLCYNLPVLDRLIVQPRARALYLFPTKALAQDQAAELHDLTKDLSRPLPVAVYDGDTPSSRRASIRRNARIIISNPDMLHTAILPHHTKWMDFIQNLRFVVLDEIHTYRGVFGSQVSNVIRRLKRICAFYGTAPQFVCASATIGNPQELAERLVEENVTLIDEDGSPKSEKHLLFYNPPLIDRNLGLRRSALQEALSLSARLLESGTQVIVFTRSRQSTEILLTYLRDVLTKRNLPAAEVRGYRGGYLPAERREIEKGLRDGEVRGVVSTNALELGIDIGHLDACIMTGYPGTIASTWQQAGRAGRRKGTAMALLVAGADPLDQYIIRHPEYFFGRSPEHALIHADNASVVEDHVRCAAFELPFRDGEMLGRSEQTQGCLEALERQGLLRHVAGTWYWMSDQYPAEAVSLRSAGGDRFTIQASEEGKPSAIGTLDRFSAPAFLHEGAIYMHEGRQYLVKSLDWENARAEVEPVSVDYYTDASGTTEVSVLNTTGQDLQTQSRAFGEVRVTSRVTGYRKIKLYSNETLGWGDVDLPEQAMDTTAYWLPFPDALLETLRASGAWDVEPILDYGPNWEAQRLRVRQRDGFRCRLCNAPEKPGRQHDVHHVVPFRDFHYLPKYNTNYLQANELSNLITLCHNCHVRAEASHSMQTALHGLAYTLMHLAPLFLMADPHDLGMSASVRAPGTRQPTIYLCDRFPGGVGFSERLYELHWDLLAAASDLINACPCAGGCPSCIGPMDESAANAKANTLLLAQALLGLRDRTVS